MTTQLKSVRKLKWFTEQNELTSLGRIQAMLIEEEQKLDMLLQHKEDYASDFVQSREVMSVSQHLEVQQEFMSNLQLAISQQKEAIKVRQDSFEKQLQKWKLASTELKAIDQLLEKRKQAFFEQQSKTEQKELDDLISSRAHSPNTFHDR